jgi:hypothetical protein
LYHFSNYIHGRTSKAHRLTAVGLFYLGVENA